MNCSKFQWNCPYDSKGNPISGCDQYSEIKQGTDKSKFIPIGEIKDSGVHCPKCHSIKVTKTSDQRFQCKACGKIFS